MKAIILAAGQGTRLRPVTLTMPKPLVPVANKALIEYSIDLLRDAGLCDIGIVVNSLESPIPRQLGDGSQLGVQLEYIVQEEQLGLAHAASLAQAFVGDEPFCMFLGDNIFKDRLAGLLADFPASDAEAAVALTEVPDPERFGIAELDEDYERIRRVVEKPENPPSNLAISGVYLFRSSIFEAIRHIKPTWRNELEITDAIEWLISQGKRVQPYILQDWWIDAGQPESIIQANQVLLGELPYTAATHGSQPDPGQFRCLASRAHRQRQPDHRQRGTRAGHHWRQRAHQKQLHWPLHGAGQQRGGRGQRD